MEERTGLIVIVIMVCQIHPFHWFETIDGIMFSLFGAMFRNKFRNRFPVIRSHVQSVETSGFVACFAIYLQSTCGD